MLENIKKFIYDENRTCKRIKKSAMKMLHIFYILGLINSFYSVGPEFKLYVLRTGLEV